MLFDKQQAEQFQVVKKVPFSYKKENFLAFKMHSVCMFRNILRYKMPEDWKKPGVILNVEHIDYYAPITFKLKYYKGQVRTLRELYRIYTDESELYVGFNESVPRYKPLIVVDVNGIMNKGNVTKLKSMKWCNPGFLVLNGKEVTEDIYNNILKEVERIYGWYIPFKDPNIEVFQFNRFSALRSEECGVSLVPVHDLTFLVKYEEGGEAVAFMVAIEEHSLKHPKDSFIVDKIHHNTVTRKIFNRLINRRTLIPIMPI